MKNYWIIIVLLTMWISGCSQEDLMEDKRHSLKTGPVFVASFENSGTSRICIQEDIETSKYDLRWVEGDEISIFACNTHNQRYRFLGETGDSIGNFEVVESEEDESVSYDYLDNWCNYAIYPYNPETQIIEDGTITVDFPSKQDYEYDYWYNSYGMKSNYMVAVTESNADNNLSFKNLCGYLKFKFYGDGEVVKSVSLKGNNGEVLAGKANVTSAYGSVPSLTIISDAVDSLLLNCESLYDDVYFDVYIGHSIEEAIEFWFVLPPTVFTKGFTIRVTDMNGNEFVKTTTKEFEIKRNTIKPISTIKVDMNIPYVTFTAHEEQELQMSKAVETLEYSVGNGEWAELGTTTVTFGGDNGTLRLRGKSAIGTASSDTDYSQISFGNETSVACSGDIRTLVDYVNYATVNMENARFCKLFYQCDMLTSAPVLPATELASNCYNSMFSYCTNLTSAPVLPATELASDCYNSMFSFCTNLTSAPELPATTMSANCYNSMFYYCTSLPNAPALPAMKLANGCYHNMFGSCEELIVAPELPAIALADSCYSFMFANCLSLIAAPKLPAMTLSKYCYESMFTANESLTSAPELPATTLAESCYCGMFAHCYSLVETPELPAITLAPQCYVSMFADCSSLVSASKLPASTLVDYCYAYMFDRCPKLSNVTMLATDINAEYCLNNWLYGVSSTGTFTKAKEMTSLPEGTSGIPSGWTVIDYEE